MCEDLSRLYSQTLQILSDIKHEGAVVCKFLMHENAVGLDSEITPKKVR